MHDGFGLSATTRSAEALRAYAEGVDLLLTANAGAERRFAEAVGLDDGFALAHAALARHFQLQAKPDAARASAARALAAVGASPRERGHVETIHLAVHGQAAKALDAVRAQIAQFPRDALVLSLALGVYGLIAFSGRREHHREQRELLESLAPHWRDDGWFLGYLGWSHTETGEPARGAEITDRALALKPRNAHAAHARAHAYVELGQADAGVAFLRGWLPESDPAAILHCHLNWHVALFELDRGHADRALDVYLAAISPSRAQSPPMPTLADCASFLWRCGAYGVGENSLPWPEVAAHAQKYFPGAGFAFADLHAAMAEAATGNRAALDRRIAALEQLERDGKLPQGKLIPVLCRMLGAFAQGDDLRAIKLYESICDDLPRAAGSHAQREVFEDTAIAACLRTKRAEPARSLLKARLERRPRTRDSAWLQQIT